MLRPVLLGVVLPALVALVTLLVTQRGDGSTRRTVGVILAIGLGFLAGYFGLVGWTPFPPAERWQWLPYLALAATLAGAIEGLFANTRLQRLMAITPVAAAAVWLLAASQTEHAWAWVGGLAVSVVTLWFVLDLTATRAPGASIPLIVWVSASAGAAILLLAGNARMAQFAGVLAAVAGALLVVAWLRPNLSLSPGGLIVAALVISILMYFGHYYNYSEVPPVCFVAPVVAPFAALLGELRPFRRARPWQRVAVRTVAVMIVLAPAVALAVARGSTSDESGDDYAIRRGVPSPGAERRSLVALRFDPA